MKKTVSGILFVLLLVSMFIGTFEVQSAKVNASSDGGIVQAVDPDWWPMFHHDLSHTGTSTSTGPNTNSIIWSYTTGGVAVPSPAVVGGFVYVGSDDRNVYRLNAATGSLVWSYTTGSYVESSPAVVGGFVYVGSFDGKVYCLNAATGAFVWSYATGNCVESSPAVVDGVVYVGSWDGTIYAFGPAFGPDWWSMFHHDLNHTGTSTSTGPTTNNIIWTFTASMGTLSSPAVVGGLVYEGSYVDVYCLNATTGTWVWGYRTGGYVFSSPAIVGGFVYVGSWDDRVYCLNATTGTLVWSYKTGFFVDSSPAVVGGLVYVGSDDYCVYCLNAATGVLVWSYMSGKAVFSSPAVVNGVVYVESAYGEMYAFGPAVRSTGGVVGITGYKLVFKETMNNTLSSQATIDYYWSFSIAKWNGTQWVASGISDSTAIVTGYVIPASTTVDLPYFVYLLPISGSNLVQWGDWLRISYTFHWTYSSTNYAVTDVAKLHVHPADIAGATPVAFPYLGADYTVGTKDLHVLGVQWGSSSIGADPTSDVARVDINGDGLVDAKDLHILGVEWGQTWTNTPPPG